MATSNTYGIILRTSSIFFGRYAYFSLPRSFPSDVASNHDDIFTDSLTNAPHFPDITILDSISSNILYQTYNSFPNFFHVYNLINRSHFAFSFPYHLSFINATILISDSSHFKVLVVCINEHPNPLFTKEGDNSTKPIVFYLYTFESKNWSHIPINYSLTSNHLLPNRRKPTHVNEDIVYLDLTNHYLISFSYLEEKIKLIPKLVLILEKGSTKLNEATRYCQSRGQLHCVRFNPIKMRIEVFMWVESPKGLWSLVTHGRIGSIWGKVIGIHPDDEGYVLLRSMIKDDLLMVDIRQDSSCVVINGRGPRCGPQCFLYGMNNVFEAAMFEGVQHSNCGILHLHENIEGPEGEVFIVSHSGLQLAFSPQNAC
ncbi:hypothetical protein KFK09_000952 [Dendrobium nobile]|uniref:Uncharacterized protein n=1 Tax=Dendrobium nobile TaxID=94219 RepID=A0A8T3CA06_DENNO|nr:hypothetical protein KFK09_000952 [Dendrobium nobile]